MDVGRSLLRLTLGPLFIGHGAQKLLGWFDGAGLEGTASTFERVGMRPGRRHAIAAGAAETAGGALLTLGMLTPLAATLLSGVMTTAIRKVHARNGVWANGGGYEYNLVIVAALAALVEQGPGRPSVDAALLPRFRGPGLALASVGAGIAGSFINESLFTEPEPAARAESVPAEDRTPAREQTEQPQPIA